MGLFFNFSEINTVKKTIPLNEIEIDGQEPTDNSSTTTDYGGGDDANAGTDTAADAPAEDNANTGDTGTDESGSEESGSDADDNATSTTDYTDVADSESGDGGDSSGEGESGGDDSSADSSSSSSDSSGGSDSPVDELKKSEEEIYNSLTPEQLDVMHRELKEKYLALYDTIVAVFDRISEASVEEEHIYVIEYVSDKLSRLKQMIVDYINNIYKGKSYTENYVNYNRFFMVLAGINKILEEMVEKEPK